MSNVSKGFSKVTKAVSKHSPLILSIFGAVSVVSTAILSAQAAPKAKECIEKAKKEIEKEDDPDKIKHIKRDMYVDVVKLYLPAGISGISGIACIIGAHKINTNRQIALAATCALTEKKFEDYQEEVKELIGDKEKAKLDEKVAAKSFESERFKNAPITNNFGGGVLYYDELTNNKFWAPPEKVESAILALDKLRIQRPYDDIKLNDFLDILGIEGGLLANSKGWPALGDVLEHQRDLDSIGVIFSHCEDEYGREVPCAIFVYEGIKTLDD